MQDIYNRTVEFGGAFASDKVNISFTGIAAGLLCQSVQFTYAQMVNRVWELGTAKTYFIGGRTSGNFTVGSLYGPNGATKEFLQNYADLCSVNGNSMHFSYGSGWCAGGAGGGAGSGSFDYTLNNVLVQQIGTQVNAQDVMLNEQISGMFAALSS